jgi:hypothetical protein
MRSRHRCQWSQREWQCNCNGEEYTMEITGHHLPQGKNTVCVPTSGSSIASGAWRCAWACAQAQALGWGFEHRWGRASKPFGIYPNPSSGVLQVQWNADRDGIATVKIMDMVGRVLKQENWRPKGIQSAPAPAQSFRRRKLYLTISSDQKTDIAKFRIQRWREAYRQNGQNRTSTMFLFLLQP